MKRVLITVTLAAIFLFVVMGAFRSTYSPLRLIPGHEQGMRTVHLKGQVVRISVADTESTRQQGLSGRAGLAQDEGMLFVFPEDGKYAFWMKDMFFSIDILWLSADGAVVYMAKNVSPSTYPNNFMSNTPARYVLELPAGYVEAHGVQIGDIVRL